MNKEIPPQYSETEKLNSKTTVGELELKDEPKTTVGELRKLAFEGLIFYEIFKEKMDRELRPEKIRKMIFDNPEEKWFPVIFEKQRLCVNSAKNLALKYSEENNLDLRHCTPTSRFIFYPRNDMII